LEEIWDMLLPRDKRHLSTIADDLMDKAESRLLATGIGRTFPNVKEILTYIREQGYMTFICSNCQSAYVEFTPKALDISDLFDQKYCAGMYPGLTKAQMVAIIKKEHNIDSGFMVGDRFHDIEAGKANDLLTIGCAYGTGHPDELKGADFIIDSFAQLKEIIGQK
ncbi:MAG: HAD hydrolase-like protein, partial [Bacillota bacterium]|nr:HAD hydrolase-like protein [Bacillota bacterium]